MTTVHDVINQAKPHRLRETDSSQSSNGGEIRSSLPALEWEPRQPLPEPQGVPKLPPELIPDGFRDWLLDVTERSCLPIEFVAVPAIIATASVIGRQVAIKPMRREEYRVIPNLWGGIVARPGLMKTSSINEALKPLYRLVEEALDEHKAREAHDEARRVRLEAELGQIKKEMAENVK
ncbi:MAG: DUF3987 domain-containing protein [Chloroflexi bacterium]|nr:DUF3987 domain-containing protein [Chloroflexota bacterium]